MVTILSGISYGVILKSNTRWSEGNQALIFPRLYSSFQKMWAQWQWFSVERTKHTCKQRFSLDTWIVYTTSARCSYRQSQSKCAKGDEKQYKGSQSVFLFFRRSVLRSEENILKQHFRQSIVVETLPCVMRKRFWIFQPTMIVSWREENCDISFVPRIVSIDYQYNRNCIQQIIYLNEPIMLESN